MKSSFNDDLKAIAKVFLQIALIAAFILAEDWIFSRHDTVDELITRILFLMSMFALLQVVNLKQELKKNGSL